MIIIKTLKLIQEIAKDFTYQILTQYLNYCFKFVHKLEEY